MFGHIACACTTLVTTRIICRKKCCIMANKLKFWLNIVFLAFLMFSSISAISKLVSQRNDRVKFEQAPVEECYKQMVEMKRTIILGEFPRQLQKMRYGRAGKLLFENGQDSLFLVHSYPNYNDVHRYLYYIMRDNHDNVWSLFQEDSTFYLHKIEEGELKKKLIKFGP